MQFGKLLGTLLSAAILANAANASIIQTNSEYNYNVVATDGYSMNYYPTSTNLMTAGQSTFSNISSSGFIAYQGLSSTDYLNDNTCGSMYTGSNKGKDMALNTAGSWTMYVNLNTSTNTNGYDITGITTISGWTSANIGQLYTVSYATVANPSTYISLGTFSASSTLTSNTYLESLQVALTDSNGVIASNVASLRFDFQKAIFTSTSGTSSNGTAYREVEVFGTATVPEPTTTVLTFSAVASLLAYAWKRRNSKLV